MLKRYSIRRWALAVLFALPLAVPHTVSAANDAAPGVVKHQSKLYIVQMSDPPVVAYTGGIAGLKATKPNRGKKIDPLSNEVVRYGDFLTAKHDAALRGVGGANKAYSYKFAFNGFAAELSDAQVERNENDAWRSRREQGRKALDRHVLDAGVSRLQQRRRTVATTERQRNGNPIIARKVLTAAARAKVSSSAWSIAASGPSTRAFRIAMQTASWSTSRSPAGTASARMARRSMDSSCNQKLIGPAVLRFGVWRRGAHQGKVPVRILFAA